MKVSHKNLVPPPMTTSYTYDDYTYCRDSVVPTQMYGGLREYTRVYIASLHFAAYTRSPPLGLCRPCLSSLPRPP
eukprot:COSAG06_NODE_33230_length_493_cov_0.906091_1_plen_74_part_10